MKAKVAVIIPAAGQGLRLGTDVPKPLILLRRKPLFIWTLERLLRAYPFHQIILPVHVDLYKEIHRRIAQNGLDKVRVILGGKTRAASVLAGLESLGWNRGLVLVHDMARPFFNIQDLKRLIASALQKGASILAVKASSTVKEVNPMGLRIQRTLNREKIFLAQTPQAVKVDLLHKAYSKLGRLAMRCTDEAQLLELAGIPVHVCQGDVSNIKITHPSDLMFAKFLMNQRTQKVKTR